jgi:ADP-heptose:LPS heptosyltransferase
MDEHLSELLPFLKEERYDYIIDLHHNLRTFLLKAQLRCPSRSFRKLNWQKWLLVHFKINRLPKEHIVDRYLAATCFLGVKNDGQGLDYFIPTSQEVDIPSTFSDIQPYQYIAFAIGAAHATKRLVLFFYQFLDS